MAQGVITAVKGALQKFVGFGEFIATSEFFSKSAKDVASVGKIDDAFQSFYERYPEQYHTLTQFYIFPQEIGGVKSILIIRAKKGFTQFPDMNRFYDRREFFYYAVLEGYRSTNVVFSLPEMIQYHEKLMGRAPVFAVKSLELPTDKKNFHKFVNCLLKRSHFIQPVNPENTLKDNLKLVTTINGLPDIYLYYVGYGLGVAKDAFVDRYFHAYTTILHGNEIDLLSVETNYDQFINALLDGSVDYPDTELVLNKVEITKDSLYDLISYHRLHYDIDNLVDDDHHKEHSNTFLESQSYISAFMRFAESDQYILKRIMLIYAYWIKKELMTVDLFTKFWKDIAGTKTSRKIIFDYPFVRQSVKKFLIDQNIHFSSFQEIDSLNNIWSEIPGFDNPDLSIKDELRISLVKKGPKLPADELTLANKFQRRMLSEKNIDLSKEIMSKFDITDIPDTEQLKLFRENWKQLSEVTFIQLLDKIGADKMYSMMEEEPIRELLLDKQKNHLLSEILIECSPEKLLKWAKLYEKEHIKLDFNIDDYVKKQGKYINGYGEFDKFDSLCELLPSPAVIPNLNTAQSFLNIVFSNPNCQRLKFYERAIILCELFKSKIQVRPKKTDLNDLIAIYILVIKSEVYIFESVQTLKSLKEELESTILTTSQPISCIIKIQNGLSNKIVTQIGFIENLLIISFRQENKDQFSRLLELLENIAASGKNHYIKHDSELLELLSNTSLPKDEEDIVRFKQVEQKLKRLQAPEVDIVLELLALIKQNIKYSAADKVIKNKTNQQDENGKSKLIEWLKANRSNFVTGSLIIIALLASASCIYFYLTNNTQTEAMKEQTRVLVSLKSSDSLKDLEIAKLQDTIYKLKHPESPLAPKIDMELPNKDLKKFDHKMINLTLESIIDTIYKRNPKNIGNHYQQQRRQYGELLIKLNSGCFNSNKVCTCDSLPHIPGHSLKEN